MAVAIYITFLAQVGTDFWWPKPAKMPATHRQFLGQTNFVFMLVLKTEPNFFVATYFLVLLVKFSTNCFNSWARPELFSRPEFWARFCLKILVKFFNFPLF
jgi:hypothetical protein